MNFTAEAKSNVDKYAQKQSKIIYATFESFVNDIKKQILAKQIAIRFMKLGI